MIRSGWCGIGNIRELEKYANAIRKNEAAVIAQQALLVVEDLKYLNGCVKRGRGEDIDKNCPAKNVFEYIKELEQRAEKAEAQVAEVQKENESLNDGLTISYMHGYGKAKEKYQAQVAEAVRECLENQTTKVCNLLDEIKHDDPDSWQKIVEAASTTDKEA